LDLLLVGNIDLDLLSRLVAESGREIKKDINYTVLGEEEFEYLKGRRDTFLLSFLIAPNMLLAGETSKLLSFV